MPAVDPDTPAVGKVDLVKRELPTHGHTEAAAVHEASTEIDDPLRFRPPTGGESGPRSPGVLVVGGLAAVALIVAGIAWTARDAPAPQPPVPRNTVAEPVTACAAGSTLTVSGLRAIATELEFTMVVAPKCARGDVLSAARSRMTITAGTVAVAAGTFDLSTSPVFVPPPGDHEATLVLRFPVGTYWCPPDLLQRKLSELRVDFAQLGVQAVTVGITGGVASPVTATPGDIDAESAAAAALPMISAADAPVVSRDLSDRWVPQISSKRLGLPAEGIVWNHADILREHLLLRLRFQGARLLWSAAWSTFSAPDFWVTAVGDTYAGPEGALGWCRGRGLDRDHCYAKLISTSHPIQGSTALQPS